MITRPPLTEPELIPTLYVTGFEVEAGDVLQITAWVAVSQEGERRIVSRLVMTQETAASLAAKLKPPSTLQ